MEKFDPKKFREQFQLINENSVDKQSDINSQIVYFDNGATTQKPTAVIDSYQDYYQSLNANVHRGSHRLSSKATGQFEQAREQVKRFIKAKTTKEIIWTKGTTESINLLAATIGKQLKIGDEILISVSEHHANIVPWQIAAQDAGALIKVIPLDKNGRVDLVEFSQLLSDKTKVVCCAHVSNVLGKVNQLQEIIQKAKAFGALTVIDGAQAIAHFPVDVQKINCDFYVFSAHKVYGPTGVGVLYGKQALLEKMTPYQSGGEMIKTVSFNKPTTFNKLPFKFEAGTPNIAGVIAFAQAMTFIEQYKHAEISAYEQQLTDYCFHALSNIATISFVVEQQPDIPVFSFSIEGHHNHDIATSLDSFGIAIRSGHHCAMPLMEYLNISGCLRVSLAAYNTIAEIDYFIEKLTNIIQAKESVLPGEGSVDNLKSQPILSNSHYAEILQKFTQFRSWDSRHREIMLLGKTLNRLAKNERNDDNLIAGCESLAWLVASKNSQGVFYFSADSDAKIIRGLLVIVLAVFNGKTSQEIKSFDINSYFEKLGLMQHLSPSRGNGVLAIVEKIKALACS